MIMRRNPLWLFVILLIQPGVVFGQQLPVEKEALLDMIERQTFRYFEECTNAENGLVMDRAHNNRPPTFDYAPATIAGTGFGLSAFIVGVERGWMTRERAEHITLNTLKYFLDTIHQDHGFFYHFIDMKTGERVWDCEVSSIDTALFMAGVLTAAEYYQSPEIRDLAERIYSRVDWQWMSNNRKSLCMGFKPEGGFLPYYWDHYSESMLMYVMALGSPTHPLPPEVWTSIKRPRGKYGDFELILCPPLFTHQYSHIWIDFRDKNDGFADYFHNSVQATLANRQFCIDSMGSFSTFNEDCWGLTAAIGPDGSLAYGAPPGSPSCDGTVAPTAAGGSIVFTPDLSMRVLENVYSNYREKMWGRFGFADSFNVFRNWFATDAYAINQGPILLMIENFRTGLLWKWFMKSPHIRRGMDLAGFRPSVGYTLNRERLPFVNTTAYFPNQSPVHHSVLVSNDFALDDLDFASPSWHLVKDRLIALDDSGIQSGVNMQEGYRAETRVLHNENTLFVKVRIWDAEIVSTHEANEMYADDAIEIYLDTDGDGFSWTGERDYQVILSPDKTLQGIRVKEFLHHKDVDPPIETAYAIHEDGYEAVVALPRKTLNIISPRVGFSVAVHNVDRELKSDCKLNWFFAEPGVWLGNLVLGQDLGLRE